MKEFKGYLLVFLGDTPASGLVDGFKEGVGGAYRCCRTCMVKSEELCTQVNHIKTIVITIISYVTVNFSLNVESFDSVISSSTYATVRLLIL